MDIYTAFVLTGFFFILVFMVYCIRSTREMLCSTSSASYVTNVPAAREIRQPERRQGSPMQDAPRQTTVCDLLKSMSTNDRREYVANFLKIKKFVGNDSTTERSSSFAIGTSRRSFSEVLESAEAQSCAICLEQFETDEDVCSSQNPNCEHDFHLSCIVEWLQKSQECPYCRRDYLSVDRQGDLELAVPSLNISRDQVPHR